MTLSIICIHYLHQAIENTRKSGCCRCYLISKLAEAAQKGLLKIFLPKKFRLVFSLFSISVNAYQNSIQFFSANCKTKKPEKIKVPEKALLGLILSFLIIRVRSLVAFSSPHFLRSVMFDSFKLSNFHPSFGSFVQKSWFS